MTLVPSDPFLPMHEEILETLSRPGAFHACTDPAERWAPYLAGMVTASWLKHTPDNLGFDRFHITEAGRQRLEIQRLGEDPA